MCIMFSLLFNSFHRRGTDVSIMGMGSSGMTQKDPTLPQKRGKLTRGYVVNLRNAYCVPYNI